MSYAMILLAAVLLLAWHCGSCYLAVNKRRKGLMDRRRRAGNPAH